MSDVRQLEEVRLWLSRLIVDESPPGTVVAFNVGLFEDGDGFVAYLCGCDQWDPDNDDWACDESYSPAERYCRLTFPPGSSWQVVQASVAATLKLFLDSSDGNMSFLSRADALTVGFDDGVLTHVK